MNADASSSRSRPSSLAAFETAALRTLAGALGVDAARRLLDSVVIVRVAGGEAIFRQGDEPDALYVVASGMVGISASDGHGGTRRIARVGPPDLLGEVSLLLTGAPRSATATALRDCVLLRCSRADFERIVTHSPEALLNVARLLAFRLAPPGTAAARGGTSSDCATIAFLPLTDRADARGLARALSAELREAAVVDGEPENCDEEALHRVETAHRFVLYASESAGDPWSRLCRRRADRIVLVAAAGLPPLFDLDDPLLAPSPWTRVDLVVVQDATARRAAPPHPMLASAAPSMTCQIRRGRRDDLGRLARILTGRALGVVLSGGGARGFAHVGVLRALAEAGISADLVGGTSIGAVIGAGLGMDWSFGELERRMVDGFVKTPPLDDYTLPVVAFTRGRKVDRALARQFGEARIETLWRPFFCVSTNLSAGAAVVHRTGPLVAALRASIAIPGLLPPVIAPQGVLVDGAMVDNLPVGAMADLDRTGAIVAIDVAGDAAFVAPRRRSWRARALRRWYGIPDETPGIAEILLRAATVSSDAQSGLARARASIVIRPPLVGVDLRAWRQFETVARTGYEHTRRLIDAGVLDGVAGRLA